MSTSKPDHVDVLIVGAGPAGCKPILMLATWLSKLKISTRIVDKRNTKVFTGQADGLQCRTVEVFQSFGFAERLVKEGAHVNEVVFWNPDGSNGIVRTKRTPDNAPGTSRFPHAVLTQGRIERFMLDAMKEFGTMHGLEVERARLPMSMQVDESLLSDPQAHAITVTLRHLSEEEATPTQVGTVPNGMFRSNLLSDEEADAAMPSNQPGLEEVIKAKYVVGCDGARSWVRKQLGLTLDGESAVRQLERLWVSSASTVTHLAAWSDRELRGECSMPSSRRECLPNDFPDIRLKCTIHSKDQGSILIVPRERNLVRFYVQLGSINPGERYDRDSVTPASILAKAQAIMHPYKLETPFVEWYTCYEIGQRICKDVTRDGRVFIAGDAFHTHSPKAGQGMNVSMSDTYNLGWKLAHVLQRKADPSLLSTYASERHQTAQELIDLDHKLSRMFSSAPSTEEGEPGGVSLKEFTAFVIKMGHWASGTAVHYKESIVVAAEATTNLLAPGLPLGKRFESHQVVSMADARPWHLGDRLESDGRWRIILFAGDVRDSAQRQNLDEVAAYLDSTDGPIRSYTPPKDDLDSVLEILTIISNPRVTHEPNDFPDILWPPKGAFGSRDYLKIFSDDESWFSGHGQIYERLGIDKQQGCVVVVRPDQTVSLVVGLDEVKRVGEFFAGFMIPVVAS
ncbi:BZ3500_MvSof-1268-A1-R1_Chr2-1g04128 [Microbotryum saponariae]|uniref:BZ3500_MvSof-1268-A1-R1_Chr2-1g04128 protein n=1 Tax=Microbotryum saponariae TaxID=289078 RepID=A0A2X0MHR3_9BASI|nr:BZ3500_MvSof-1268-A1-R1_Chr2-1g04128 [Microbotryum saponariae]SCZ91115.1 BZ3501_MvSof-1269-A2-R1_Chr2-1g03784 [Microbotryum saponariae]